MKAIIIGGGIGGLSAGLCFNHFGWDVEILEQAPDLGEVGAGLQVSPNAMKVFEALDLGQAMADKGFRPEAIELRMGLSGMHLIRATLGDVAEVRWGSPYLHIHRADLISVLQSALETRAAGSIRLGCNVTGYVQTSNSAAAILANGERVQGDVLIGADGIHSAIRTQMHGPDRPVFTGNVAWRALVPVERLGKDIPNPVAGAWMGRGKHAVTYLLRNGKLANLVAIVERDDWTKEGWSEKGSREEALKDFAGWHPIVTRLIEESEELYRWALFDRPSLNTWTDNCVALMGDAAHPMLPFMAQGAAIAIEDAWVLAQQILTAPDIMDALAGYETARMARGEKLQNISRGNAKLFHESGNLACALRSAKFAAASNLAALQHMKLGPIYGVNVVKDYPLGRR